MSDEKDNPAVVDSKVEGKETIEKETKETVKEEVTTPKAETNTTPSDWLSAGTSWGSSWLQSAKQKTFQTLELVKKDLDEFKDVMAQEVSEMTSAAKDGLETVGAQVKQQTQYLEKLVTPDVEEAPEETNTGSESSGNTQKTRVSSSSSMGFGWMKNLVDTVKNLTVEDTTEGEDEITEEIRPKAARHTILPPAKLRELQFNEETYTKEPEDPQVFADWMQKFNMEHYRGEVNILLQNTPALREIYAKLVPATVDNFTFWSRYFFRVELAEIDEEMKYTLKELKINTELKQKVAGKAEDPEEESKTDDSPGSDSTQQSQPQSGERSNDDWSDMGKEDHDIEEIGSTDGGDETEKEEDEAEKETLEKSEKNKKSEEKKSDEGPLTPKPKVEGADSQKEDGWVDWDE